MISKIIFQVQIHASSLHFTVVNTLLQQLLDQHHQI